jgi:hypothetical protein
MPKLLTLQIGPLIKAPVQISFLKDADVDSTRNRKDTTRRGATNRLSATGQAPREATKWEYPKAAVKNGQS